MNQRTFIYLLFCAVTTLISFDFYAGNIGNNQTLMNCGAAQGDDPETFEVTFNIMMDEVSQYFNPDIDVVYITGSMLNWAVPGEEPELQTMHRVGDSFTFTQTFNLEVGEYEYKYFLNEGWSGGIWYGEPNFTITVVQDMNVDDIWNIPGQQWGLSLILLANSENAGTVTGEGSFLSNAIAHISATPFEGFDFVKWTRNDDEVVSTDADYQFNMPNSNLTLTAHFDNGNYVNKPEEFQLKVFPNPSQNYLIIKSASIISNISISDIGGKVFLAQCLNNNEFRLDHNWNPGVYIFTIETANGVFVTKLLIQ
ncbi:MAG: T9SS type A sorting domain-containing protein [Tenuifilaceae bacterium]|jgi:uncharacterized repeat protein (TIGR02543 family)|nr:T9SS type A sorting domain-containing protein [Bacteroidales bacterium]MDI9516641.1 T9SS type A sorting domain-containing protein [Bacteroidota bacterium]HNV80701.1 T9SS type A sorting domain-containing protein [Tenuifilaceae bacterium]MZP81287.1 T9SS type A sorting domain-containing protein [Bacteroidales bacterium]HOF90256.1 T9SS type A sorting domain-containing protein [Tenuifilaceae bacterium]